MRFRSNKNPTGEEPGNRDRKPKTPPCPECQGTGGAHRQVRVSKQRRNPAGGVSNKYDIVWENCPRAGGKGGKR